MMLVLKSISCFLLFLPLVQAETICKSITAFNSICENGTVVYVLSASPCQNENFISVTIINTKNYTVLHKLTSKDIDEPLLIGDEPGKGVVLEMHNRPATKPEKYSHKTLHLMLFHVDIESYKSNKTSEYLLLSHQFFITYNFCHNAKKKDINAGFKNMNVCDTSLRMSEFSTLCIVNETKFQPYLDKGAFFLFMDPCSTPYAGTVVALTKDKSITAQYTTDKNDTFIGIDDIDINCGLNFKFSYQMEDIIQLNLYYQCKNNQTEINLIEDIYHTEFAKLCPLSNCKSVDELHQSCEQRWISEKGYELSHVNISIDVCQETYLVLDFSIVLNNTVNSNKTVSTMTLKGFFDEEMQNRNSIVNFNVSSPYQPAIDIFNGYLPLYGGQVTLNVHGNLNRDIIRLTIVRLYPSIRNEIPLVRTEFDVDKNKLCASRKKHKDGSLKITIPLVVVSLVIFCAIVVGIIFWRRKHKKQRLGLPFQIQVANEIDDEFAY